MAKSNFSDPFRRHRFGTWIGFDGLAVSTSRVQFKLGVPWRGPGALIIAGQMSKSLMLLLKGPADSALWVGLFTTADGFDSPSAFIVLDGLDIPNARVEIDELDCTSNEMLCATAEISYKRLEIVFGSTLLDALAVI